MAKQTFTTGQVLTAAQMTSLQQTAMGGGSTTAKTTSYTLVAADAGTVVQMNSASATTITVNTALFAAGDTVQIQNIGAGVCTVTAGTATVNTAGSLALSQYEGGQLYFNTTSAALFFDLVQSAAAGGKVLQVVQGSTSTGVTISSVTYTDTGLTASITPSLASSKVLVLISQQMLLQSDQASGYGVGAKIIRGATTIVDNSSSSVGVHFLEAANSPNTRIGTRGYYSQNYLDSPATTSSTTYKVQMAANTAAGTSTFITQGNACVSTIILMEIGA